MRHPAPVELPREGNHAHLRPPTNACVNAFVGPTFLGGNIVHDGYSQVLLLAREHGQGKAAEQGGDTE